MSKQAISTLAGFYFHPSFSVSACLCVRLQFLKSLSAQPSSPHLTFLSRRWMASLYTSQSRGRDDGLSQQSPFVNTDCTRLVMCRLRLLLNHVPYVLYALGSLYGRVGVLKYVWFEESRWNYRLWWTNQQWTQAAALHRSGFIIVFCHVM